MEHLLRKRRVALRIMEALRAYHPRLLGSVATGAARPDSDIDLNLYCDDIAAVRAAVAPLCPDVETTAAPHGGACLRGCVDGQEVELAVFPAEAVGAPLLSALDGAVLPSLDLPGLAAMLGQGWTP